MQEREKLEALSRLSAGKKPKNVWWNRWRRKPKHKLLLYINDIMDDAKLTANKGSQTNRYPVHPESCYRNSYRKLCHRIPYRTDEIKGRIIGREGRNIRAQAATGAEIVVDDTLKLS